MTTTINHDCIHGADLREGDSLLIDDTPHKIGRLSEGRGVPGMRLVMFSGPSSSGGVGREVYVHNDQLVYIVPRPKPVTAYPAGTLIKSISTTIIVRTDTKDQWIRVRDGGVTNWNDEAVQEAVEEWKTLTLLFTPDTKEA